MAREIIVYADAAISTPTIELVNDSDSVTETITLTEETNALGKYKGTVTAPAAVYTGILKAAGAWSRTFGYTKVTGADPETVIPVDYSRCIVDGTGGDAEWIG